MTWSPMKLDCGVRLLMEIPKRDESFRLENLDQVYTAAMPLAKQQIRAGFFRFCTPPWRWQTIIIKSDDQNCLGYGWNLFLFLFVTTREHCLWRAYSKTRNESYSKRPAIYLFYTDPLGRQKRTVNHLNWTRDPTWKMGPLLWRTKKKL